MPFERIREQHQVAGHLPHPLYVLFMQASAYKQACGRYCNRHVRSSSHTGIKLCKGSHHGQELLLQRLLGHFCFSACIFCTCKVISFCNYRNRTRFYQCSWKLIGQEALLAMINVAMDVPLYRCRRKVRHCANM